MPDQLTVALDGTPLTGPIGGIRRFTDQLLQALRQEFPDDNYILLSDQFAPTPKGLEKRWWFYGLNQALARTGSQLFHGTDFAVPYVAKRPSIMTVHDLSPWREPSPASSRVRSRASMLLFLRIPTFVHTPSHAIRDEVIDRFRFPAERVIAIPHAAAAHFTATPAANDPYFLYLGTLESRKNLEVLEGAIDILWQQGLRIPLYLVGQARNGYQVPYHAGIKYLGPKPESELPGLLSNAKAVLYPSRYEGFGLPIVEAMQCGAPVIASNIQVHREVGGQAVLYASALDASQWACQMRNVLTNRPACNTLLDQAARFSWRNTAIAFRDLYLRCLS